MKSNKCKDTINKCVGEIIEDPIIEIIKRMHCEPGRDRFYDLDPVDREAVNWGLIKEDTCKDLNISLRTFQTILKRLDTNNLTDEPVYICGQPVKLDIKEEKIDNKKLKEKDKEAKADRRTRFCTPNTMHPIFLQLNVSQLACLFKALAHYDDSGISAGLGAYIYSQLSEYGVKRIEETYARQDETLRNFLYEMFDMCESGEDKLFSLFKTDVEIYEASDYRYVDTLNICCKNSDYCDLELKINGQYKKYKHKKVEFADDGYKVSSDRQFFSIENIENIKRCTK